MNKIRSDSSWYFKDLSKKQTNYISHGYHKYPAKFIPQMVERLIKSYSRKGDVILDNFGGCGTTLVESKINGRSSFALDVNKAALLITEAKRTAIEPQILEKQNKKILEKFHKIKVKKNYYFSAHPRLQYWFKKNQYNKLMEIFLLINKNKNKKIKTFYRCCFSNILKNCSIWYSRSVKPMVDHTKPNSDPIESFEKHLKFMTEHNKEYYHRLENINLKGIFSKVLERDARDTKLKSNSIDLIVTSPPYAISYEYADLHQLTLLWFKFTKDMNDTKKKFIGTASSAGNYTINKSQLAQNIIKKLSKKDNPRSKQIEKYYSDLYLTFKEMYRVLKMRKRVCIILGDTEYKSVKIKNMEVSLELLKDIGFNIEGDIIKRKLSSKIFTPYRDDEGKFTDSSHGKKRKIYQYEYIIVARK